MPSAGRPEPPTEQLRAQRPSPLTGPTRKIRRTQSPADARPTQKIPSVPAAPSPRRRDRQTIVLIGVIVLALLAGGLAGAELFARHRADTILVAVAECVVAGRRLHLLRGESTLPVAIHHRPLHQHLGRPPPGNRVQSANGMTADVTLKDVRLQDSARLQGHHRIAQRDTQLEVRRHQGHRGRQPARRGQSRHRREHRPRRGHVILEAGEQQRHGQARRHRR